MNSPAQKIPIKKERMLKILSCAEQCWPFSEVDEYRDFFVAVRRLIQDHVPEGYDE